MIAGSGGCQVALVKGSGAGLGYGGGYGAGSGMGMHALAGGSKAVCGSLLGVGFFPLAMVAAVGYLGYKVYAKSKNEGTVL